MYLPRETTTWTLDSRMIRVCTLKPWKHWASQGNKTQFPLRPVIKCLLSILKINNADLQTTWSLLSMLLALFLQWKFQRGVFSSFFNTNLTLCLKPRLLLHVDQWCFLPRKKKQQKHKTLKCTVYSMKSKWVDYIKQSSYLRIIAPRFINIKERHQLLINTEIAINRY